jgi:hypothetical protein
VPNCAQQADTFRNQKIGLWLGRVDACMHK